MGAQWAQHILDWLDATRYLTSMRCKAQAKIAWAKIFARHTTSPDDTAAELSRRAGDVPYDTLRQARCRFDILCMLLWRFYFSSVDVSSWNFYLYIDGSPQWRGVELLATSIDIFRTPHSPGVRRLLPVLQIGQATLGIAGKCYALLWQLFLMIGPYPSRFREVLNRMRSITADMGTEAGLHMLPDVLGEFFQCIGVPAPGLIKTKWLFPRAI